MIRFDYGMCGTRRVLTMSSNKELIVRPLQENERYTAISHTWGDTRNSIEGIGWDVPSWISCLTCKALVEAYNSVWIDSLCIKQFDEEDVKMQIKEMHNIYRSAQGVVVVLVGNYSAQLSALRRTAQLLINLEMVEECTLSSSDCLYVKILEEMRDAVVIAREMPWFRRVWTLQEAILSVELTFVGFNENSVLQTDVTTIDELTKFTRIWDEMSDASDAFFDINDYEGNIWLAGSRHPCSQDIIDTNSIVVDVGNIMHSIKPLNLRWYKDLTGKDAKTTLEHTTDTVFRQLGSNKRECQRLHDLVYGICALFDISLTVDYNKKFEDVFLEALQQLVKQGVFVLPERPQPIHGYTWLPNLEHIDLRDVWRTVRDWDFYHNVKNEGTNIFAKGNLVQMRQPHVFRSSMKSVADALKAIVPFVPIKKDFDVSCFDPSALTITCVVLWMYKNHGRNDMQAIDVESLIYLILCGHMQLKILQDLHLVATDFAPHGIHSARQINYILECCDLVWSVESVYRNVLYLHYSDAILVLKKKMGLVLYNAPSPVQASNTYGVFYKRMKFSKVHGITSNVLAQNSDGIWDNHGRALFWYISRWDILESKVLVGTVHSLAC
ncbi:uncharacterized protein [Physcomitrium patens]|uniref:Heterokaryon incompatibility domain-containing protein n=1 Tax=Physcomitrium patens TaxID=3218 RepID=A0A2K1JKA8_PHYPA|nr:uncharacterized protein LOC112290163 [Physcomitrium patens]XP_024391937.1 uncharacterized protein LOC112290163 [Physcomitrium patens]XP_024391938.1 uncharacterized protein LOC112290163 [Physcomitrium patens]XP_024391940.1 uncharacterized protein LOC112290163 [Physcomitrium patens]XP_024391941.1 uncharacterized protein LOC112290163 [Physcomitrium patens]PNR41969.1 hypothetical protein PHYPA_016798 [Physcomitrium patens]|eukprot:XP_024391936.1 uncharacterized protein LOC112290163 [Physcomitrella patens]